MIALTRFSGLQPGAIWSYLFTLSILSAIIPCLIAFPLSIIVSQLPIFLFENIPYEANMAVFANLFGMAIFFSILIAIVLKYFYLSKNISDEMAYVTHNT